MGLFGKKAGKTVLLDVPDMNCGHCEMRIQKILEETPGVLKVKPDAGTKQVNVSLRDDADITAVLSALAEGGYPATLK
jgi:copper chaperone